MEYSGVLIPNLVIIKYQLCSAGRRDCSLPLTLGGSPARVRPMLQQRVDDDLVAEVSGQAQRLDPLSIGFVGVSAML